MSKHVDQLIKLMREKPAHFMPMASPNLVTRWGSKPNNGLHMTGGALKIWKDGVNTKLIYGSVEIPLTWWDGVKLRRAVERWYREADTELLVTQFYPDPA